MKVRLTEHAVEQLKRRENLNKTEAYKVAIKAWECGEKVKNISGDSREFLKNKDEEYDIKTTIRFYKGFKFIFTTYGLLITAYKQQYKGKSKYGRHNNAKKEMYLKYIENYMMSEAI